MLFYLGQALPEIAFAVHQCAHYTFEQKESHEEVLKQIGHYLKGTLDTGLILDQDNITTLTTIKMPILLVCVDMNINRIRIVLEVEQYCVWVNFKQRLPSQKWSKNAVP
jgi:hypothetical protein